MVSGNFELHMEQPHGATTTLSIILGVRNMDFVHLVGEEAGRLAEMTGKPNYFLCTNIWFVVWNGNRKNFSFATKITLSCFRCKGVRGLCYQLTTSYKVTSIHNVQEYPFKMYAPR